ncbi:transposase [Streptomyces sp. NPDC004232]|uniref:transposase n=1 Tax=Streptomyces sp. NPDC004232 TaxID=3154454 RepID=UPI0033A7A8B7
MLRTASPWRYTEEFKRDAIALVDSPGKTVTAVARELGISSESLRGWYRKAKADRGGGQSGELTSACCPSARGHRGGQQQRECEGKHGESERGAGNRCS